MGFWSARMPVTLIDLTSDAATRITMQWREPYLTEAINKKMSAVVPQGVHRGWRLGLLGTEPPLTISILPDPVTQDNVLVQRATTSDTVTIKGSYASGRNLYLGASGIIGTTVVIAVFANYTVGVDTTASIRAYPEAEWLSMTPQQQASVVPLGKVVVPASGPIPAENITPDYRSMAWENIGADALPWEQLVRNGGFETAPVGTVTATMVNGWDLVQTGTGEWEVGTFPAAYAHGLAFHSGTGPSQGLATQVLHTPCRPGQRVKLHFSYQTTAVASVGTARVYVTFEDLSGAAISVVSGPALLDSVGSAAQVVEALLDAPAQCNRIGRVAIECSGVTALVDSVIFFDDIRVLLDPANAQCSNQDASSTGAPISTAGLTLEGPDSSIGDLAALLTFNQDSPVGEGQLKVARKDGGVGIAPMLNLLGRIMAGSGTLGTDAQALLPRLATEYKADVALGFGYTQLWAVSASTGMHPSIRMYAGANQGGPGENHSGLYVAINGVWSGTQWIQDQGSVATWLVKFTPTGCTYQLKRSGASPWTDTQWDEAPVQIDDLVGITTARGLDIGAEHQGTLENYTRISTNVDTADGHAAKILGVLDSNSTGFSVAQLASGAAALTVNASWDAATTKWRYINGAVPSAFKIEIGSTSASIATCTLVGPTWMESEWSQVFAIDRRILEYVGGLSVGSGLDAFNEITARLATFSKTQTFAPFAYRTLIWSNTDIAAPNPLGAFNLYFTAGTTIELALNATWGGTSISNRWHYANAARPSATLITIGAGAPADVKLSSYTGTDSWTHPAWVERLSSLYGDLTIASNVAIGGNLNVSGTSNVGTIDLDHATVTDLTSRNFIEAGSEYQIGADDSARYKATHNALADSYTLLAESLASDYGLGLPAQPPVRMYAAYNGGLVYTTNARWDAPSGSWVNDLSGSGMYATGVFLGGNTSSSNGLRIEKVITTSSTSWLLWGRTPHRLTTTVGSDTDNPDKPRALYSLNDGTLEFQGVTSSGVDPADRSNPPYTTPIRNQLRAKNLLKAWGSVRIAGIGASGVAPTVTCLDGFNVASATPVLDAFTYSRVRVLFAVPMANENYALTVTDGTYGIRRTLYLINSLNQIVTPMVLDKSAAGFSFQFVTPLVHSPDAGTISYYRPTTTDYSGAYPPVYSSHRYTPMEFIDVFHANVWQLDFTVFGTQNAT